MQLANPASSPGVIDTLAQMHPADAVEALNGMAPDMAAQKLAALPFHVAVDILDQAGLSKDEFLRLL